MNHTRNGYGFQTLDDKATQQKKGWTESLENSSSEESSKKIGSGICQTRTEFMNELEKRSSIESNSTIYFITKTNHER